MGFRRGQVTEAKGHLRGTLSRWVQLGLGCQEGQVPERSAEALVQAEAPVFSLVAGGHGCQQGRAPPGLGPETPDVTALLSLLSGRSLRAVRQPGAVWPPV